MSQAHKAPLAFKRPLNPDAQSRLAKLAERVEAEGNGIAGQGSLAKGAVSPEPVVLANTDTPATASMPTSSRSGTHASPYVRASDGTRTRSTTIHLPVDLHQRLKIESAQRGIRMSALIETAVRQYFKPE